MRASPGRWIAGCAILIVPLAAARLAVIPDEAYYWTWAQAPALRYYDHPPGVALILAAASVVLGDGLVGLRALSVASMIVTAVFSVLSARRLVRPDERSVASELALVALLGAPMFTIGFLPLTPDPLHGALTAIAAYLVIRTFEGSARAAFLAGFVLIAAVGLKHYAALIAAGALYGLLATADGRRVARQFAPWLGAASGVAILSPWLVEELRSGGGSIAFQAERVLSGSRYRGLTAVPLMAGSLLGTLGPASAAALVAISLRLPRGAPPACRVLGGGALALLAGCLAAVWMGSGEANWPLPALIFALPAIVATATARPCLVAALRIGALATTALLIFALVHVVHPFLPVGSKKDPTRRGVGFDRMAAAARDLARDHGTRVIVTRRYQWASLLRYHVRDTVDVLELGTMPRRGSQYDLWPRPAACAGDVVVLAFPHEGLPPEIEGRPLAEARTVPREGETWWVRALRLDRDAAPTRSACEARRASGRETLPEQPRGG